MRVIPWGVLNPEGGVTIVVDYVLSFAIVGVFNLRQLGKLITMSLSNVVDVLD